MTSSGRTYTDPLTGDTFPSVTNVLRVIDKPALFNWNIKRTAEYAVRHRDEWAALPANAAAGAIAKAVRDDREAADRGSAVHAAVHEYVTTGALVSEWPNEIAHYVERFAEFCGDFRPRFLFAETTCYSATYGYAGTLDLLAELPGLGTFVLDVKTGGVWPEAALQLCAYRHADYLVTGPPWERHPMPETTGAAVLQLHADRYALVAVDTGPDVLHAFLFAAELSTFRREQYDGLVGAVLVPGAA